jgi:two-component system chemotaxis response regulator CheY
MPVMDGVGFIRSLREKNICGDTPVVFITTEANEDRLNQLMDLGASGYIRKPFRPEVIGTFLSRIMGETDGFKMGTSVEGCDF